jgi:O-acetyl-ADP-ribose deacetylase (regulator of RNase III)
MPNCFVIMPFGQKKDPDGKDIDFDTIYKYLIKEGVEQIEGLSCTRCDEIEEAGVVHKKMLEQIYQADVAVVDITTLNPNVFYELGVRHTLADHVTVIIKREDTKIPFNIRPLNAIDYEPTDIAKVAEAKKKIVAFIKNGLNTRKVDSLVHESLPIRIAEETTSLKVTKKFLAPLGLKKIGIITGDMLGVEGVDVWVSSENTNMHMARFYERSISGTIRYHGAQRNQAGQVIDDILQKELTKIVGESANVDAGTVIATSPGELAGSNGVKRIFHAAAVYGQVSRGFVPIINIADCVKNALKLADSKQEKDANLRNILFPLLGTGQGGGKLRETVKSLLTTAKSYLENKPASVIQEVYFLCYTEREFEECKWAFAQAGLVLADA